MGNNNSAQPAPLANVSPFANLDILIKQYPEASQEYQALNNFKTLNT
jgi:hypothetical protein